MKTTQFLIPITIAALLTGCAAVTPIELTNARLAYQHASESQAAQLVPAELHKAHEALALAEKSFLEEQSFWGDSISYKTKDLAYVAQRKAELAETFAIMTADKTSKEKAGADFQSKQAEIMKQRKQDLIESEKQAAETFAAMAAEKEKKERADADLKQAEIVKQGEQNLSESEKRAADAQAEVARLEAEKAIKEKTDADLKQAEIMKGKKDLSDSEKRTADALAALASLAAVKKEERGLVVTLSGSVLFRSDESTLLTSAQTTIDQVANALMAVPARNLIVEGHTDSQGSDSHNQDLSQRRADAVRDYLVERGYPANRIQAQGKGEGSPIADNDSPEGRANNRRVEIIIEPELHTSNQ